MKIALLIVALGVFMITIGLVHSSLDPGATNIMVETQNQDSEVASPSPTSKESTQNAPSYVEVWLNVPERDNQTVHEQPNKASYPDVVNPTETDEQVSGVPSSENSPIPTPVPDGRIFNRGEPPYGYLPTCSPRDGDMPFVPVEPD